jgi:TonB family protein
MTGLPYTAVCNGRAGWVYYDKGKHYEKVSAAKLTEGYCTPGTLTSFEHVADDVTSAVITGTGRAQFEGRSQPCIQVHAHYRVIRDLMVPPGMAGKIGRVDRRMCIDRTRKLILWDQFEADMDAGPERYHILETVTYDRIERNPDLPATLFDFQPPEGATLSKDPEPPPEKAPLAAATPRALHVHALPSAISRVEPEYSQEAWDEGIQGTVIVLPEINLDGSVGEVKIRQSLGYGLDQRAIECVRKWKFNPATDDRQARARNGMGGNLFLLAGPAPGPALQRPHH